MATLVTGALGCIGAWVCRRPLEAGEKPVAFMGLRPQAVFDITRRIAEARPSAKGTLEKAGRLDARELEPAK